MREESKYFQTWKDPKKCTPHTLYLRTSHSIRVSQMEEQTMKEDDSKTKKPWGEIKKSFKWLETRQV